MKNATQENIYAAGIRKCGTQFSTNQGAAKRKRACRQPDYQQSAHARHQASHFRGLNKNGCAQNDSHHHG